jgi:hypothetical protein
VRITFDCPRQLDQNIRNPTPVSNFEMRASIHASDSYTTRYHHGAQKFGIHDRNFIDVYYIRSGVCRLSLSFFFVPVSVRVISGCTSCCVAYGVAFERSISLDADEQVTVREWRPLHFCAVLQTRMRNTIPLVVGRAANTWLQQRSER